MKVKAKNEQIARVLRHPTGATFGADLTSHWPVGQFTTRRIRDGDVTVVEEAEPKEAAFSRRGAGKPAPKPAAKPAAAPPTHAAPRSE